MLVSVALSSWMLPVAPALAMWQAPAYTSTDMVLLVVYVLLALVFSFLCSIAEAVLLSITPSYIAGLQAVKPKLAALLQRLKQDNVDQSLAAILTLNTIAHTVGAIGSGAKATVVFGSAWFGVFSAVMTLLILFFSEIIPKTLGAVHWRALARPTAAFVRGLIVTLYPLIWVSEKLTYLIAPNKGGHGFKREEFIAMAGLGAEAGELDARESRIIHNLLHFGVLKAQDVMTPRIVVVALPEDLTIAEGLEAESKTAFSRLPLYRKGLDDITGFVLKHDMLLAQAEGRGDDTLASLRRDLLHVEATMPLSDLLASLLQDQQHIALVVGPYGGTAGLVTLEDVVETLLDLEIVDERDHVEDMQAHARQKWANRALALGLDVSQAEAIQDATTDSGQG